MDKMQNSVSQSAQPVQVKQEKGIIETQSTIEVVSQPQKMTLEERKAILEQLRQSDLSGAVRAALIKMLEE